MPHIPLIVLCEGLDSRHEMRVLSLKLPLPCGEIVVSSPHECFFLRQTPPPMVAMGDGGFVRR